MLFLLNISMPITLAADAQPDLTIAQMYVPIRDQYAGSPFNAQDLQVTIKNLGSQQADNVALDFLILNSANNVICQGTEKSVGAFSVGETKIYTFDRYLFINCPGLEAGENTLRAVVDYKNSIAEDNENNNYKEESFSAKDATGAPTISNLVVSTPDIRNKQVRMSYRLANVSDSSVIEYVKESLYAVNKKYDITGSPNTFDKLNYNYTATTSSQIPYRYRAILNDSNIQTPGQIFILMPPVVNLSVNIIEIDDVIEVKNITSNSAAIIWSTAAAGSTKLTYEANNSTVDGSNAHVVEVEGDNTQTHAVDISGLSPDTQYYFKVESSAQGKTASFISYFYTNEEMYQAPAPIISGQRVDDITVNSAMVRWNTDINSSSKVIYEAGNPNVDGENAQTVEIANDSTTSHAVNLTGLSANTKYYYKVESTANGQTASQTGDFTTAAQSSSAECINSTVASPGDLIKMAGLSSVYYYGNDCKRYVFPNERTYLTWYSDYSKVKTISQTDLTSAPLGDNITYRPGVKMVKITTDPKVYAVTKGGVLRWVKTESIASALYGENWNTKIDDVPDSFFVNYEVGEEIDEAGDYDAEAEKKAVGDINIDKGL